MSGALIGFGVGWMAFGLVFFGFRIGCATARNRCGCRVCLEPSAPPAPRAPHEESP